MSFGRCVSISTSLSWDEKWTWNHRDFYIFIVRNKRFCAMEVLVGRPIRVPRAVFSEDIRRGCTKEPPDGTHWDGSITAFSGVGSRPFSIVLTVLDPDDDDDKLMQEELDEAQLCVRCVTGFLTCVNTRTAHSLAAP